MQTRITGTILPVLEVGLEAGEKIIAEPGEFSWMSPNIVLNTTTATAGAKGLFGVLGRAISGGGLFMTEYTAQGGVGVIAFAAKVPGTILEVNVEPQRSLMVHRHGFLCATEGAQLSAGFQRSLGAGIFGGNGFLMQKLEGPCKAWIELGGESVMYELKPGEQIKVHPGHVGMFEDTLNFDVVLMRGIKNALFGGDGLFIAQLTGPGKLWLQTLTVPNLAHALEPYIRPGSEPTVTQAADDGIVAGVAGSMLRGIFGDRS
jgi:uncharacterized protein (TIGR00266 family)